MLYMVTFTINIPPMLVYIPYMDPMGKDMYGKSCKATDSIDIYGKSCKATD